MVTAGSKIFDAHLLCFKDIHAKKDQSHPACSRKAPLGCPLMKTLRNQRCCGRMAIRTERGRLAQRERRCFTRTRPGVRIPHRPPLSFPFKIGVFQKKSLYSLRIWCLNPMALTRFWELGSPCLKKATNCEMMTSGKLDFLTVYRYYGYVYS